MRAARGGPEVTAALAPLRGAPDADTLSSLVFLLAEFPDDGWAIGELIEDMVAAMPRLAAMQRFGADRDVPDDQAHLLLSRFGHRWSVCAVLTLHRNGFVREAAILRLAETGDSRAYPFLLNRTTDWVPAVARAAEVACEAFRLKQLSKASPTVARALARRSRGSAQDLLRLLREDMNALVVGLSADPETAQWILSGYDALEPNHPVAVAAQSSPYGPVRAQAARLLNPGPDRAAWAERLMRDPFPEVRLLALEMGDAAMRERALLDASARVRAQARILLGGRDYAANYRAALPKPTAIEGLGETGTRADAGLLTPLLAHESARVRHAAVRALALLDARSELDAVRGLLRDPSAKVVREAIRATKAMNGSFAREEVEAALAQPGRPAGARRATLAALGLLSRWNAATVLVKWGADPDLRDAVPSYLESLAASMTVRPTRPRPEILLEFVRRMAVVPWMPPPLAERLRGLAAEWIGK